MPNKIEWATPEYNYYQKDKVWIIVASVFTLLLIGWAIWTKNILFAILIALGYFLIIVFAFKKPDTIYISLSPRGITVNTKFYEFEDIESFWIFYDLPETKELSIKSKSKISPYIVIPLGDQSPIAAREYLIRYIPEKKQTESLLDNITRGLRF